METFRWSDEAILTDADAKRHLIHAVIVPEHTLTLDITLSFEPWIVDGRHNMLTLTVQDPMGSRGAGHRHGSRHHVRLSTSSATPGFLAGPITPGVWQIEVDTHMVLPGVDCAYSLEVMGDDADDQVASAAQPAKPSMQVRGDAPGWYRGDLHAHSTHSDATWTVADLVAFAKTLQLDFVTLSDHNTTSGLNELTEACGDDLLGLPAQELTTFQGHALALGLSDWIDWRTGSGRRSMAEVVPDVEDRGGLFVIAHPRSVGDPICTGCDWTHSDVQPGPARRVEVWNGEWHGESQNEEGLALAIDWLNAGHRLVLTAGTDHHGHGLAHEALGFNVVWASALTAPAILAGIRQGQLYLSSGPELEFEAVVGEARLHMGDSTLRPAGSDIQWVAHWRKSPAAARVELIVDGVVVGEKAAGSDGTQVWGWTSSQARWGLLSLRAANGSLLALTNPIFLDGR